MKGEKVVIMTNMGQAVEEAIKQHHRIYKESEVYGAHVRQDGTRWRVELEANHFSVPLVYYVEAPSCKR